MRHDLVDQLERLVDGELSDSEQVTLLKEIDSHQDIWRWLALRLLEEQAWRGALRQPGCQRLADRPVSDLTHAQAIELTAASLMSPAAARSGDRRRVPGWAMAAAALLLVSLGFSIGSLATSRGRQPLFGSQAWLARDGGPAGGPVTVDRLAAAEDQPSAATAGDWERLAEFGAGDPAMWGPVGEFRFVDYPGAPHEVGLPLYAVERLTPEMLYGDPQQWQEIEQWQERFREVGHRLNVEQAVFTGVLEDGSHLVIPTWQFQLLPETL